VELTTPRRRRIRRQRAFGCTAHREPPGLHRMRGAAARCSCRLCHRDP